MKVHDYRYSIKNLEDGEDIEILHMPSGEDMLNIWKENCQNAIKGGKVSQKISINMAMKIVNRIWPDFMNKKALQKASRGVKKLL